MIAPEVTPTSQLDETDKLETVQPAAAQTPKNDEQDGNQLEIDQLDGVQDVETAKKGSLSAKMAKNFQKRMKKMANKTGNSFQGLGKDMTDGIKKMSDGMRNMSTSKAITPSTTPSTRSRTSSRASSMQRGLQLHTIKDTFDAIGRKITSLKRGQELTFDDVFGADQEDSEDMFDQVDFVIDTDWGDSWPSFDNFDMSLYNLKDKSSGLSILIADMCEAESKYANRMRVITKAHLKAYQKSHQKMAGQPFAERTTHIAMLKLLQTAGKFADHHELQSWSVNTFLDTDMKSKITDANEKMIGISAAHKTAKKDVTYQLGRVKTAKTEYNRRVTQLETAQDNYEKLLKSHPNGDNIKEEDKLRNQVEDKKALVTRATEEHDAQVATYNELQKTYYSEDLPALCRSQKEVHLFLTDIWKTALEEFTKKMRAKIEANAQEIALLEAKSAIGGINKNLDANILFKNVCQDNTLPAPLNTIQDLEQFQFPTAPPRSSDSAEAGSPEVPKSRKLSEAVCLLGEKEKATRMKQLAECDDMIQLADGRVFKIGTVDEDYNEDIRGSMAVKKGTYVGVTRNEAVKQFADHDDGWIKVTNLETEQSGYIPYGHMTYVANT